MADKYYLYLLWKVFLPLTLSIKSSQSKVRFLLAIAFSILILFSCQKEKVEKKLQHKWKYISVREPVIFFPTTYWSFEESKVYVIQEDSVSVDTTLWGDYTLKNNFMMISGVNSTIKGGELFKGNFQMLQLNDSLMVLVRKEHGDGLIYHEFVKAN